MLFNPIVLVLLLLTFAVQEFVPAVEIAHQATLFLPPVFFFSAAVAVPFSSMLLLAFVTGLLWDARYLPVAAGNSASSGLWDFGGLTDPSALLGDGSFVFGLSILLFGLLGTFMQGIRPLFKRGRLELPVLMVGIATFGWLLIQYLLMTFLRGSLHFPSEIWSKMVTDTMLAMLVAPLLYLILYSLARLTSYEIKYEGLRYNFDGR